MKTNFKLFLKGTFLGSIIAICIFIFLVSPWLGASFLVFTSYVLYVCTKYGLPKSISDSYYILKKKHRWVFTLILWGFAVPLIPAGDSLLMVLAVMGIAFVGAAPAFKDFEVERRVHVMGATAGVVLGMVSLWTEHGVWYVTVLYAFMFLVLLINNVKNVIFWIEVLAFYLVIFGLLIEKV